MTASRTDPLDRASALIARDPESPPTLAELARTVGLSPTHLQRRFTRRFGLSPKQYAQALRLQRFKGALREGREVTDAVYEAGFGSASRVYENVDRHLGMTPGHYRRGGEGLEIRYTIVATPIGRLLVATTERGICAVTPGRSDAALLRTLVEEFPKAHLERVDAGADDWLAGVVRRVARQLGFDAGLGDDGDPPLTFDVRGTAFQWQVWQTLMRIPTGETRSYAQVAEAVGRPRAARAVARACASNRLALVVPCHRVVREDGSLGGYRWGVQRKHAVLAREAELSVPSRRRTPADAAMAPARSA